MAHIGQLSVEVLEGRGISVIGIGLPDPYVVLKVGKKQKQRTVHKNNTKSPQWNQKFTFDNIETSMQLKVQVWDHDTLMSDDKLGVAKIKLEPLGNLPTDAWYTIRNKSGMERGSVRLVIRFNSNSGKPVGGKAGASTMCPPPGYNPGYPQPQPGYPPQPQPGYRP